MDVLTTSIALFLTQFFFIGARTWNVKAIADHNIPIVLISGFFIHLMWLLSITIGVISMTEIMQNFKPEYLIIIIASASGGMYSSYLVMKKKNT